MTPRQRAEDLKVKMVPLSWNEEIDLLAELIERIERYRVALQELAAWDPDDESRMIARKALEGEELTEEQIEIGRAKSRILGEAIRHCSKPGMENHCDICRAVYALEALIPEGNLEALRLALLEGTRDGDQEARA
jgi:hypothetical protein